MTLVLSRMRLYSIVVFLTCLYTSEASSHPLLLGINGLEAGIPGFPGLNYEAARYEPLCGQFGTAGLYDATLDFCGDSPCKKECYLAMNEYSNNTDTLAIYDLNGIRLRDVRVGGGLDLCMCFSLARTDNRMSDFCFWVSGTGQVDVGSYYGSAYGDYNAGDYIASCHRPNSQKALPICGNVDVASLSAKWSSTAYEPSVYEVQSTVGNGKPTTVTVPLTSKTTETTTFIPSIVSFTSFSTVTSTLADGNSTTFTTGIATQLPVVTATAPSPKTTSPAAGGYSLSDRIALGVGIGLGLPTVIIGFIALIARRR